MNILESAATEPDSHPAFAVPSTLASVLVIDDEEIDCFTLTRLLKAEGYDVVTASSGEEGVELLRGRQFEVVIADLMMPGMNGIQAIAALKKVDPDVEVIILTGYATVDSTIAALRQGARDYLLKPIDKAQILPALTRALAMRRPHAALPMYEASRPVLATLNREDLIPAALALAEHTMRAGAAALALAPSEESELEINLSRDDRPLTKAAVQGLAQQAIETRSPMCSPSTVAGHSLGNGAEVPAGSVLTYPLEVRNAMLGALVLWRDQGRAQFSAFDVERGKLLADEIAIALDNARLYRELSHKVKELETARREVARAEAGARAIIETAQEAIVLFDKEGIVWDLNPQAGEMFGRPRDQIVGCNLADFAIPPGLLEVFKRHLETACREGKDPPNGCLEVFALRQNGEEFPLEISTAVIETPRGKLLSTFARDITERKRAEKARQESEAKLQTIFDGVETGIFLIDPEAHRIVDANPVALKLVGAPREHVLGATCHKFVCPADQGGCPVTDLGQEVDNSECMLLTVTGKRLPIIKTVRRVVIAGRHLLLESFVDISARKRAEEELRRSEAYLAESERLSHVGSWVWNVSRKESVYWSEEHYRIFDMEPGTGPVTFQKLVERIHPEDLPTFYHLVNGAMLENKDYEADLRIVLPDGSIRNIHSIGHPVVNQAGEVVEFMGTAMDVTARKRADAEMAERHLLATLVAEVGAALTGAESMRQGLQQCAEILVRTIGAAFARVWTANEAEGVLELQASAGMYTHIDGGHARVPVGKFKIGRIAESGEPHLTNTVQEDSWVGDPEWARREGMVAFAGYPLKVEERVLGVVGAFSRQPLTESTLQAFASVADNLAQFIKRKRAEQALRESEERYRLLFERNLAGVFRGQLHSRTLLDCNDAYARILGYESRQEVLKGGKLHAFYDPTEFEIAKTRLLNELALTNFEVRFCHRDQAPIWVLVNASLIEARKGEDPLIEGTLFDITERKQAEHALARERDLLRALMDNVPDCIYFKDRESRFVRTNMAHAAMFGLHDPVEMAGKTDFDFFTVEHAQQAYDDEQEMIRTGTPMVAKEEKETWPDGRVTWACTTKIPLRDANGNIVGTFGVSRDITVQKRAEDELYQSRQMLQSILDTIPHRVFWKDQSLTYLGCNRAFAIDAGLQDPVEITGKNDFDLAWRKSAELYRADDELVMVQESAKLNFEERQSRPDGSVLWLRTNKLPLRDPDGRVIGVIGTYEDITCQKRSEEALRESESRFRRLTESNLLGILVGGADGRIAEANAAFLAMLGYTEEDLRAGMIRWDGITPTEYRPVNERIRHELETSGVTAPMEVEYFRKDGSRLPAMVGLVALDASASQAIGFVLDLTERKQAERALQERTVYLDTLFEISPLGIVALDIEGCTQMSNSAFERLFGYSRDEITGAKLDDFIVPNELAAEAKTLTNWCLGGASAQATSRRRRQDGTLVDVDIYGVPLMIEGKLRGFLALYQDITERKRAEADLVKYAEDLEVSKAAEEEHAKQLAALVEELARERDLLGTVMDNLPDYVFSKDRQSRFLRTNPAHAKTLGLSDPREAVGKTDFDFFPAEDAENYFKDEQQVIETGQPLIGRVEKVHQADGQLRWCSTSKVPMRDTQGRVTGLVGITRDMTERMQAEEILRASEERYRELFENASDMVYTTGLDTRLTSLNRVGQQILGYSAEEATQLDLRQLVAPKHWEIIVRSREQLWAGKSDLTFEVEVTSKDGRLMMLEVKPRLIYKGGKPVGVQGIARDITGRDAAEMELRHAQKLESVGRLAAGIAHEINTPIQFVGDNTRFLQDSFGGLQTLLTKYQALRDAADSGAVSPELLAEVRGVEEESDCAYLLEEIPKALAQTLDGVTRVATIVRAMKEFAHPEGKEMAAADLNRALLSTLTVARNELKYVADVETDLGDLPLVVCNIGDLNQVFLNLLVNAAHAISEVVQGTGEKGKIRVCTWREEDTVLVTIRDTGGGIPEAIRGRIFDPFFTTKEVGRGTGQGLAIARSVVVDRHKGTLTFESEVGKGTTFYLRLPVDPEECSKEAKVP